MMAWFLHLDLEQEYLGEIEVCLEQHLYWGSSPHAGNQWILVVSLETSSGGRAMVDEIEAGAI